MSDSSMRILSHLLFTVFLVLDTVVSSGQVVNHTIPAPGRSQDVTWDRHHIWVTDDLSRKYHKLNAETGEIIKSYPFPEGLLYCDGITFDGKFHWICGWEDPSGSGSKIYKMAPDSIGIISSFDYPGTYDGNWPHGITYGGSVLWANNMRTVTLDRIDPDSGELIGSIPAPSASSVGIAYDGKFLWTNDTELGLIYKQDPVTGQVLGSIPMPAVNCRGMEWDGQHLWTVSWETQTLYRINVGQLNIPEKPGITFSLYPNPGQGIFHISTNLQHPADLEISVCDLSGRKLFSRNFPVSETGMIGLSINLSSLQCGIYLLLLNNSGNIGYRKLILEK